MSGPQSSKTCGFDSELEKFDLTLKGLSETLRATQLFTPNGSAERNSAGGGRQSRAEACTPCWIGRHPV
eukprot:6342037-Amphidinium_carterae.1